jgi:hypothetical protein
MKKSRLLSNFEVTNSRISLHNSDISPEEFADAVLEFCRASDHARSRLGDLLNSYEQRFGGEKLRNDLINTLVENRLVSRKTCDNARSFAKKYQRRWDEIPDAWAEEIISIPNERERNKVRRQIEKRHNGGNAMNLQAVRVLVKAAKASSKAKQV